MAEISNVLIATGRRKTASARVRLTPGGTGKITINDRDIDTYCFEESLSARVLAPFRTVEAMDQFDAVIRVFGGGPNGQADAIRLGVARALERHNPEWRSALKKAGHLKRDPRKRERKKAGQPGARKRFQFSKR